MIIYAQVYLPIFMACTNKCFICNAVYKRFLYCYGLRNLPHKLEKLNMFVLHNLFQT